MKRYDAVSKGQFSWENLFRSYTLNTSTNDAFHSINSHENEVMKIYSMECLKLAYENAEFYQDGDLAVLDYDSITNEKNIIK